MSVILELQDKAIRELETIFDSIGFVDGRLDNKQNKPLYYKNTIPNEAWGSVVTIPKSSPKQSQLLMLYKIAPSEFINADNVVFGAVSAFNITVYYDNIDIWVMDSGNMFMLLLGALFDKLETNEWNIQEFGETAFEAVDSSQTYNYSRGYKITKTFIK